MTTSDLSPAFVLHRRKYRDTSLILELFTRDAGRVSVVHRGGRNKKGGQVQPYCPLLVAYTGKGDLKTLTQLDEGSLNPLAGNSLFIGIYLNELLVKLLPKYEPMPGMFDLYQGLLVKLVSSQTQNHDLRQFELALLNELGYGVSFDRDAGSGEPIIDTDFYRYVPDEGFHRLKADAGESYQGAMLLAIDQGEWQREGVEKAARRVTRTSINHLLGGRPLKSRELFEQLQLTQRASS